MVSPELPVPGPAGSPSIFRIFAFALGSGAYWLRRNSDARDGLHFEQKVMTIHFDIPKNIEEQLRSAGQDPTQTAKELFFVELYRKGQITHHELGEALGLGRYETDGLLKRHDVPLDLSIEEVRAETAFLDKMSRE